VIYMHPGQSSWPRRQFLARRRKNIIERRKQLLTNLSKKWVTGR
jgi:hypothetical protein